jgi:carnitine 3-dehydrogenase
MTQETYLKPEEVRSVAVIGTGSVGASWTALFLAHGLRVVAFDPSSGAEGRTRKFIEDAWPALFKLSIAKTARPDLGQLSFVPTPSAAANSSDVVQENVLENLSLKKTILAELDGAATADKIILSSTGGIAPSQLQSGLLHPERFVVVHPFNPAHLIPLVEVVGGKDTSPAAVDWALNFARLLGKHPIRLNAEASGHMTNRLQFALVREAVNCLLEGIASAQDIDAALRFGLAPRWMLMGSFLTLHLAGGKGGMRGILDHAGPAIEEWWTPTHALKLTEPVKARLVQAAAEVSGGKHIDDWIGWRDQYLVDVLKLQVKSDNDPLKASK